MAREVRASRKWLFMEQWRKASKRWILQESMLSKIYRKRKKESKMERMRSSSSLKCSGNPNLVRRRRRPKL